MINNLREEVEGLKSKRRDLALVVEVEPHEVEPVRQLEEADQHLANHAKQLRVVWSNNQNVEDEP